tara:strand:- start:255 stop:623 length:369 start_codon:yes stop_codon:yes gene_type:complete
MVKRLSKKALLTILSGKIKTPDSDCFIKFYSNGCPYCHELAPVIKEMEKKHGNGIYFFAFNVGDYDEIDKHLGIQGVPSIVFIKIRNNNAKVSILEDVHPPHPQLWYHPENIETFLKEHTNE